jgi:hypothetical protein
MDAKFCFAGQQGGRPVTNADYRYMATEIRDVIPLIVHPQAAADLRLLADRYERLAQYLDGRRPDELADMSFGASRRVSC